MNIKSKSQNPEFSWKDSILKVLKNEHEPIHYTVIAQKIEENKYRSSLGANPQSSVNVTLQTLIKENSVVSCEEKGCYMLKEYEDAYKKDNPIETADTMICAYGRFWNRNKVDWKSNGKTNLYGNQGKGSVDVNFADEKGIYLLHRGYEIVYVGQATKQTLAKRLAQHTKDSLTNKWDSFSWFGIYCVDNDGKIETKCSKVKMDVNKVIESLEALLIESVEPRFNNRAGNSFNDKEYQQK